MYVRGVYVRLFASGNIQLRDLRVYLHVRPYNLRVCLRTHVNTGLGANHFRASCRIYMCVHVRLHAYAR
jgi:hypothetical protein